MTKPKWNEKVVEDMVFLISEDHSMANIAQLLGEWHDIDLTKNAVISKWNAFLREKYPNE